MLLHNLIFSERIGWIPSCGDVPQNIVDEYKWIFGLSITEMEIVHGAYRKDNPNCRSKLVFNTLAKLVKTSLASVYSTRMRITFKFD